MYLKSVYSSFSYRKLATFDTWSSLAVHIAMDNTVVMEEISKYHVWVEHNVSCNSKKPENNWKACGHATLEACSKYSVLKLWLSVLHLDETCFSRARKLLVLLLLCLINLRLGIVACGSGKKELLTFRQ